MSNEPVTPRLSPGLTDLFIPARTNEIAFWTELAMGYGRVVVDWHCGTGELAMGLAQSGLRVVGVDPDPDAIEMARARYQALGEELTLTWLCYEPRLISLPGPADFAVLSGDVLGDYLQPAHRAAKEPASVFAAWWCIGTGCAAGPGFGRDPQQIYLRSAATSAKRSLRASGFHITL